MDMYEELINYCSSGIYPMHMPGHKRNPLFCMKNPYEIDVTEVEGTDDLHHPEGMIRDLMDRMKRIYGTKETYLLVNGSTCGILTAISACAHRGDTILMDRNCHYSVYHAVYLLELEPVYLYPDTDPQTGIALGIRPEQVEEALCTAPAASCVVVTSPTYEGVVSKIAPMAEKVHERGIPLIVDEAHGAHFTWGHRGWQDVPAPAMSQGADLVIESLHKTLPALTQTGVLHVCTDRVATELVERYLQIYMSSSPSYILMAGAAQCIEWMEREGQQAFLSYQRYWRDFCRQSKRWKNISLWEYPEKEPSKLVILSDSLTGCELSEMLRKRYQIQMELAADGYVLAMTSICDTEEGWKRLAAALTEIDEKSVKCDKITQWRPVQCAGTPRKSLYAAMNSPYEVIRVEDSMGRTSAEYAYIYPPGIPFLVPGEEITEDAVRQIRYARDRKLNPMGLEDPTGTYIRVCI